MTSTPPRSRSWSARQLDNPLEDDCRRQATRPRRSPRSHATRRRRNKLAAQAAPRDDAAVKAGRRPSGSMTGPRTFDDYRRLNRGMLRSQALRLVPLEINSASTRPSWIRARSATRWASNFGFCGLGELVDDSLRGASAPGGGATDGCGRVHYCEMIVGGVPFRAAFDVQFQRRVRGDCRPRLSCAGARAS